MWLCFCGHVQGTNILLHRLTLDSLYRHHLLHFIFVINNYFNFFSAIYLFFLCNWYIIVVFVELPLINFKKMFSAAFVPDSQKQSSRLISFQLVIKSRVCLCPQAEEAEATYRTCIADATTQQQELEDMKVNVLKQIQELIRQTDQILRAVRVIYVFICV